MRIGEYKEPESQTLVRAGGELYEFDSGLAYQDALFPSSENLKRATTRGRCLVAQGIFLAPGHVTRTLKYLSPEALMARPANKKVGSCGVLCFSIIDYLLELNAWSQVENVALLPYYGTLKWTKYEEKVLSMFRCLADVPLTITGPRMPFIGSKSRRPDEDLDCSDILPKVSVGLDAAVMDRLLLQ